MQVVNIDSLTELPQRMAQYTAMTPDEAAARYEAKYGVAPEVVYSYTNSQYTILSIEVNGDEHELSEVQRQEN